MPAYDDESNVKLRLTGLWAKKMTRTGSEYMTGAPLRDEDIQKFIEFCREPTKFVVWPNSYKKTKQHPDGYIWLYRHISREAWEEIRGKRDIQIVTEKKEETPF